MAWHTRQFIMGIPPAGIAEYGGGSSPGKMGGGPPIGGGNPSSKENGQSTLHTLQNETSVKSTYSTNALFEQPVTVSFF